MNNEYIDEPISFTDESITSPEPINLTWGETISTGISKVPSDAIYQLKSIYNVIRHPVESIKGFGQLGLGIIEKLIPGDQEHEKVANAVWEELKGQYGGIENIKRTIAEHPVQVGFDISTLLLGGGAGATRLGLKGTGSFLTKTGQVLEPTNIISAPVRAAGKIVPSSSIERTYLRALKPRVETPLEARDIARFGLDKNFTIRYKTWQQVENKIKFLKDQVETIISKGAGAGGVIDTNQLMKTFDDIRTNAHFIDPERPDMVIKRIEYAKKAWLDYFNNLNAGKLSPMDVQRMKVRLHELIGEAYGEFNPALKKTIQKGLAYEMKISLENLYPDLKKINISEGELIEFNKYLGRRVMIHEQSDLVRNIAFMIKAIVDQPYLTSKLAIWLNKAKKGHPLANPQALKKDLLFQLGRFSKEITQSENIKGGGGGGYGEIPNILDLANKTAGGLLEQQNKPVLGIDPMVLQHSILFGLNNPTVINQTVEYLKQIASENPEILKYMGIGLTQAEQLKALMNLIKERGLIPTK